MAEEKNLQYLQKVKSFVIDNFPMAKKVPLANDDNLLIKGVVDSLGLLLIVDFLEAEYGISVHEMDVVVDNFGSFESISAYVGRKLSKKL